MVNNHYIISTKNDKIENIPKLLPLTTDQLQTQLDGLNHLHNNDGMYKLMKEIADYLTEVGERGATLQETLQHLSSKIDRNITIDDKQFLDCINIMAYQSTPPIIAFVGFRESYIVLTTELDSWAIFPPRIIVNTPRTQIKQPRKKNTNQQASNQIENKPSSPSSPSSSSELQPIIKKEEKPQVTRSKTIIPRIWRDVNGNITQSVWNGCSNTLFETIFNRPGITLGQLSRIYYSAMTMMEMKEILDHMVTQGVLRKVCVSTTLKLSSTKSRLFTKKIPIQVTTMDTVDDHCQTSYWVSPGYYNHIS